MTTKEHIQKAHGLNAYMVIAFLQYPRDKWDEKGRYERVVYIGRAPNDTHESLFTGAARFGPTASLTYDDRSAQWVDEKKPFLRLVDEDKAGWCVRIRDSVFELEPECECICGWKPEPESAENEMAGA